MQEISQEEIGIRDDGYHTYHLKCGTDMILPSKQTVNETEFKELKKYRTYYTGVLYCPVCHGVYRYPIKR